ncbi:hypothetical protein [Streptomyces sp. NPDC051677]|uniref:hypothetical protein n=1 Tax=Streptomyces sp. NPDC051677 TaxID=3365669 RepID=UPI0037D53D1E
MVSLCFAEPAARYPVQLTLPQISSTFQLVGDGTGNVLVEEHRLGVSSAADPLAVPTAD